MDREYSMYEEMRNAYRIVAGKPKATNSWDTWT
jgi:hypothetical protein